MKPAELVEVGGRKVGFWSSHQGYLGWHVGRVEEVYLFYGQMVITVNLGMSLVKLLPEQISKLY